KVAIPKVAIPKEDWEQSQEIPSEAFDSLINNETVETKIDIVNKKFPRSSLKTAAEITAATTPDGIPVDRFEEGDIVMHPTYGNGTIASVEGRGVRRMARVTFGDGSSRSFQLSKCRLTYP
ncbi:MAG: hypothetical protein ABL921_08570, partial [Pirellula sp.]